MVYFSSSTPSFGGSATTAAPATTGTGLFGSSAPKPATTGLFGSTAAKPAFGSGGGFGASTTSTFGASTTPSFGAGSTGAFGAASGTSAFGGGTSTFGGGSTGLFSGASKFGATATAAPQIAAPTAQLTQAAPDASYIQAFTALNEDPYGTKGLQEAFKLTSLDANQQAVLNKIVEQVLTYREEGSSKKSSGSYEDSNMLSGLSTLHTTPISLKLHRRGLDEEFSGSFKRTDKPYSFKKSPTKFSAEKEAFNRELEYNRVKQDEDYLKYTNKFLKSRAKEAGFASKPAEQTQAKVVEQPQIARSAPYEYVELTGPNIIRVKVNVFVDDAEEVLLLSIDRNRTIRELIELAVNKLKNKYSGIESSLIQMVHKSRILSQDNTLEDSGVQSGMKFDMLVQEKPTTITPTARPEELETVSRKRRSEPETRDYLVSTDKLPIATKPGYRLNPSLIEMARMTEYELMNVRDLFIENEHGKIQWVGRTNVIGINFDELVRISTFAAEVYPAEVEAKGLKPEVGLGLNKPAIISLYKVYQGERDRRSPTDFEESLKRRAECLDDCTFLGYDRKAGILTFRVEHFTKYDFSVLEEEEEVVENEESEAEQPKEKIVSIQKAGHEKGRFSFGTQEPRQFQGSSTPATLGEAQDIEDMVEEEPYEDEDEMEVEGQSRTIYKKAGNFLDDIQEEPDSRPSSVIFHESPPRESMAIDKKNVKLHFGDVIEKEIDEEKPYEYQEYEEEEEEEQPGYREAYVMNIDDIRARIKNNKIALQQSLTKLNQERMIQRRSIPVYDISKLSVRSGFNNQMLFLKRASSVTSIFGTIKMSYTSNVDKVYSDALKAHRNTRFSPEQKDNLVEKYLKMHYSNILENHLHSSHIKSSDANDEVTKRFDSMRLKRKQAAMNTNISAAHSELPVMEPPSKPYEFSELWFETLRKSREILSPNVLESNQIANVLLSEIKRIVNKDCQVFALLNACFGNSFIDLAKYMNRPGKLTKSLMDKYKLRADPDEEKHRNHLISNLIKYSTEEEIKQVLASENDKGISAHARAALHLYSGNKNAAAELLKGSKNFNLSSSLTNFSQSKLLFLVFCIFY